jgi:hypothetical protein
VYEKSSAEYADRLLLIDEDHLDKTMDYRADFESHGFDVICYKDDLNFRIEYEDKVKKPGGKIVIIAESEKYIPYDVRRRVRAYAVSLSDLFPRLDAQALKDESSLDYDLLSIAYDKDYESYKSYQDTKLFLRMKVYTKATVQCFIKQLLQECMTLSENCISYRQWYSIAEKKAKIDTLAMQYNVRIDTSEINRRFKDYILKEYGKLSSNLDSDTPILVSKAMEYMHDHSKRFVIVVMDGMSEFDWKIISSSFKGINYEKASAFAMIPTVTSISRQCLLSNKYPKQLINPWSQSKEKNEFTACARDLGFADNQISYQRGYDADFGALIKCGVVIINDVDDMMHGQKQGRLGMYQDIGLLAKQHKLADMTKRFLAEGLDVYISADHGNTFCTGMGKLMGTGVETETKSRRMIVLKDFADKQNLIDKCQLIDFPKYYLFKEFDYLICDEGRSFDAKGEEVMSHGGITIDEVVVPFIKIKAVDNNG